MAISGSFSYAHSSQRENDYREATLATGFSGVAYLSLTVNYAWNAGSSVSQTVQIRDSNGNSVATGSGSGNSGTFYVTATTLNPNSSYYIWGSASSFLGATYAVIQASGSISYSGTNYPVINSFSASPNPQDSGSDGIPDYTTTLSWTTTDATTLTIVSGANESWDVTGTSTLNITNLPQSDADGTSPATRTYTLYAGNQASTVSSTITVEAYNDNTPSNSWNTSFINLEKETEYEFLIGTLSGVDMKTEISVLGDGNFVGNGSQFSDSFLFDNGDSVILKTTSLPFNTDLSGLASDAEFGKTNSKTVTITTPDGSYDITLTTRAPVIKENFNYSNNISNYPYEDIDLIPNTPTEYTLTSQINVDDIEIPMEIKLNNPDAQVSINGGSWQSVREI